RAVSHIQPYMPVIEDQVSGQRLRIAYGIPRVYHLIGSPRQAYAEMGINGLDEPGAVRSVCQACPAPYIRVPDKLACIVDHRLSCDTAARENARRSPSLCRPGLFRPARFLRKPCLF